MKSAELQSAKILAFPVERIRRDSKKIPCKQAPHAAKNMPNYKPVNIGDCWYHDEALTDKN